MFGSPIEDGSWNNVTDVYYVAAGSGELVWLVASGVLCIVAIVVGSSHESCAYKEAELRRRNMKQ